MKLKAIEILRNNDRIASVDMFRGLAILSVVLFHFNHLLPYGYLGVDLFFVISGLLVGGILTRQFAKTGKVNYIKFFLQRGGKIWPSYYFFIIIGSVLAHLFYTNTEFSNQIIEFWDYKRYLLFYQNYTGHPMHWSFDHVWSICVEEHFYLILPLMFLLVILLFKRDNKWLFIFTILTILSGIGFKYLSWYYTNSQDTYSGTHNRIDALAWGVLLNLLLFYHEKLLLEFKKKYWLSILGLLLFALLIYIHQTTESIIFKKIWFQSIVPFSFFLMILGVYHMDFSKFMTFRLIAYYSYNWYLWHPIFVMFLTSKLGSGIFGLLSYLIVTFFVAVIVTIFVEEPMLKIRNKTLKKYFVPKTVKA